MWLHYRQAKIRPWTSISPSTTCPTLQALDFNLSIQATGNVAVDFLLFSTSGLKSIVLREIKALLSQARELDRVQIPSRSAIRDPNGRDDFSLGLF